MMNRFLSVIIFCAFILFSTQDIWADEKITEAKSLAEKGEYQEAYELLLQVTEAMENEIDNQQGTITHYKKEVSKLKGDRPDVVDHAYNKAATRLWTSAWKLQHDGVFRKSGNEKEECLLKAVATYKRIVIDYPYADKAEEAQYRTGRVYYKFLKDKESAAKELQRYLDMYPNGKYASDARSMLTRIRGK